MKRTIAIGIALMAVIALIVVGFVQITGYASKAQAQETINLGVIAPLTGSLSFFGEWMGQGFELALEDINKEGVHNKQVKLVYQDTVCSPRQAIDALQFLHAQDVAAYLGSFCGSEVQASAIWADEQKEVIVNPGNNFGKLSDYFFNTEHLIVEESAYIAEQAYNLGKRRIGILARNNDWGITHAKAFKKKFESLGGKVTTVELFNSATERDYRTQLTKIKNTNPDGIFIAYSAPGEIINQIQELDLEVTVFGERGLQNQQTLNIAGKNAEGIVYSYPGKKGGVKTPTQKAFIARYKELYGGEPHLVVLNSYDALMILAEALNSCDDINDKECIAAYIKNLEEFDGARGVITVDGEFWNMHFPFHLKTVRNGEYGEY